MSLPGEVAILAIGVDRLLAGHARWTPAVHARGVSLPIRWRRAMKAILAGGTVEAPEVPPIPDVIPTDPPPVLDAPPELLDALGPMLLVLSPIDDTPASVTPVGPLARPLTIAEEMRRQLLWRTVAVPDTVLSDASRGGLSYSQLDAIEVAYPEMLATWRDILTAEMGRLKPSVPLPATRQAVAMILRGEAASPAPSLAAVLPEAPGAAQAKGTAPGQGTSEATAAQQSEAT